MALALITLSVTLGLAKVARRPGLPRVLMAVHEHSALAGLIAIAVHGITLLGDRWLHPGPVGIAVPFAMEYRPLWSGLGIVAGYLAAALGVAHAVGAGRDADATRMRAALVITGAPVFYLFTMRVLPSPRNDLSGGGSGARPGSARCRAARSARSRP